MSSQDQALAAKKRPVDQRASIAVDLGAESCRVSLLRWVAGKPELQLVHRFANGPVRASDDSLRWPLQAILANVEFGIRQCAAMSPEGIRSLAVDGWAVDYVRLDKEDRASSEPFCYRDKRNAAAAEALHKTLTTERMREITGVEQQPLNTVYQLYADRLSGLKAARWLNLPEYLLASWGAEPVGEYTNATHTQLIDFYSKDWSREIFVAAGLDLAHAPRVVPPGTLLGKLSGPLSTLPALQDTDLIAPACHDTASAIAGISEADDDWAYISCGTWSLVGTLVDRPLNSPAVCEDNFTNLGGIGGSVCFHKSVNGMWMLKQCMDRWKQDSTAWELPDLLYAAEREPAPVHLLHVDDPAFLGTGNMPSLINAQLVDSGLKPLSEEGEAAPALTSLLMHSLAARYAEVIQRVRKHSGKELRRIVMVGGGAQNAMLRRLIVEKTGLDVVTGPTESATIGNLGVQLAVLEGHTPVASRMFRKDVASWSQLLQHSWR